MANDVIKFNEEAKTGNLFKIASSKVFQSNEILIAN